MDSDDRIEAVVRWQLYGRRTSTLVVSCHGDVGCRCQKEVGVPTTAVDNGMEIEMVRMQMQRVARGTKSLGRC